MSLPLRLRRRALAFRDRRARARSRGPPLRRRPPGRRGHARVARRSRATGSRRPTAALTLDFTEELWETAYFDLAELRAVDHPAGVALVANEKMVPPPFPAEGDSSPSPHPRRRAPWTATAATGPPRSRPRTASILAGFAPTRYQGIVAPHELVLELPEARAARPGHAVPDRLDLLRRHLDQRVAVAAPGPGGASARRSRSRTASGGWKTAIPSLGYPAGKTKTMPVDLSGVLDRADPRVRIRTNLAIYWDRIAYTVDEAPAAAAADAAAAVLGRALLPRVLPDARARSPDGPQVFVHDDVSQRAALGRHGRALHALRRRARSCSTAADDRYVVMKGGDAVRLRFDAAALPPLPAGWVRDYLIVLDGWDKDADKNTVAGPDGRAAPVPRDGRRAVTASSPFPRPRRTASSSAST